MPHHRMHTTPSSTVYSHDLETTRSRGLIRIRRFEDVQGVSMNGSASQDVHVRNVGAGLGETSSAAIHIEIRSVPSSSGREEVHASGRGHVCVCEGVVGIASRSTSPGTPGALKLCRGGGSVLLH